MKPSGVTGPFLAAPLAGARWVALSDNPPFHVPCRLGIVGKNVPCRLYDPFQISDPGVECVDGGDGVFKRRTPYNPRHGLNDPV